MEQQAVQVDIEDVIRALGQHRLNEITAVGTIRRQEARIQELEALVPKDEETQPETG